MATFTKGILSGSTNGRAILVAGTNSAGATLIHTVTTTTTTLEEIWLYAHNYDTTARKLTIEWGTAGPGANDIEQTIPAESGLVLVVPGLILKGAAGQTVEAFAATGTAIAITGYIHTIA